jgi:hypothetical protein
MAVAVAVAQADLESKPKAVQELPHHMQVLVALLYIQQLVDRILLTQAAVAVALHQT